MVQLEPATFISEALNLNSVSSELAEKWSVLGSTRLSVEGVLVSGSWGSASVVIRGSVDGSNWTTIATLTGVGFSPALDVASYELIDVKVSVAEGSVGTAEFHGYATSPPFEKAATGTTDVAILSPTLDANVGESRVWVVDTETKEALGRIAETLDRIQQQLELITGVRLEPGDSL